MAEPTIKNGKEQFFPIIYEGNGGGQRVGRFVPFTDQATIANSLIFNRADNPRLAITPSSASNRKTFTFSAWIKRANLGSARNLILTVSPTNGSSGDFWYFDTNDTLKFTDATSSYYNLITNRTFEDTSKWYHLLISVDTTQATASNRMKVYIDGDQISSFSTETYPSQDFQFEINNTTYPMNLGGDYGSAGAENAGYYLAEVNIVDGQQLTPASFGITDTSTGRWIPKTVEPFPTTTTDIAVTVVSSGGNKYALDGVTQDTVTLIEGATYKFDQSDSSNSGHPLRFSTTSDGTHGSGSEYTTGVTTVGTPGSSGAYTQITVATGAPTLYYYCSNHSGMGGTANTQDQYGTNGFRLKFQDSSALGDDTSGNENDFSVSNLVAGDQTTDSPTQNFPTIDSNRNSLTLTEGNTVGQGSPSIKFGFSGMTFDPSDTTGYYLEFKVLSSNGGVIGFRSDTDPLPISTTATYVSDGYLAMNYANDLYLDGTNIYNGSGTWTTNDIIGFYIKENKLYYSVNGTMQNSSNHVGVFSKPGRYRIIMGHNSSVGSAKFQMFCPQSKWTYTPSGDFANYREINQDNAPETAKGVSGFTWLKDRDNSTNHYLVDSSRNYKNALYSNATDAEVFLTAGLRNPLKGGFEVLDGNPVNGSGRSFVAWNWVANGGTTASNTNGSITSTVQANTTAGFSIVEFTTPSSTQDFTVGHGLSVAPRVFFFKRLDSTSGWAFYHQDVFDANGNQHTLFLNTTNASYAPNPGTAMYPSATTATTFSLRAGASIASSANCVAYCFNEVDGFSKFGSYKGNGSSDGAFIYTGFQPAWVMIKCFSTSGNGWTIHDNKRMPFNGSSTETTLYADSSQAEQTSGGNLIDFLSNGFKLRGTNTNLNGSRTYIYMAFAEHPFVGDGTNPVTAR